MMTYAIGIDYGTQSARAELVRLSDGAVVASAEGPYAHGVMEDQLPSGVKLGPSWAVQDGRDSWDLAVALVRRLVNDSQVDPSSIIGLGIDATSCTMLALDADLEPLSALPEFADEPLAHVLLWKHHAAQPYADELNRIAAERGEAFLPRRGKGQQRVAVPQDHAGGRRGAPRLRGDALLL
jgi:L-ribulokinase